jgi:sarcosine oxidase subunit alpha
MKDLTENISNYFSGDEYRVNERIIRGAEVEIIVDGEPLKAYEGESIAAAILVTGRRSLRTTSKTKEKRGLYCSIGICFDCGMTINNIPNIRTCQTKVEKGMIVETQKEEGKWRIEP